MRRSWIKKMVCSVWLGYKYYTADGDKKGPVIDWQYMDKEERRSSLCDGTVWMILMAMWYFTGTYTHVSSNVTVHRRRIFESQVLLTPTVCGSNWKHLARTFFWCHSTLLVKRFIMRWKAQGNGGWLSFPWNGREYLGYIWGWWNAVRYIRSYIILNIHFVIWIPELQVYGNTI